MYSKKYLKLLSQLSNEEQAKYLININSNQENELKPAFQNILKYWFQIYGEDEKMTFQQFYYFWSRNTDKQADKEPEHISKNFFTRHARKGNIDWDLQSFLSYFAEKSSQRPNLVLRMLLCHDFDYTLRKLENEIILQNDYGSQKVQEEKDLKLFSKRMDCHKISLISKQNSYYMFKMFFNKFLSNYKNRRCFFLQSISIKNQKILVISTIQFYKLILQLLKLSGILVMEEYLKLLSFHKNHLQRIDIKPLKVVSFIRVNYDEINELSKILLQITQISILDLNLNIKFVKQR